MEAEKQERTSSGMEVLPAVQSGSVVNREFLGTFSEPSSDSGIEQCIACTQHHGTARRSTPQHIGLENLPCAVIARNKSLVMEILQRENVTDRELMDLIHFAAFCRASSMILFLLKAHPRSRRVFKQYVHNENWFSDKKNSEELKWMFHCLNGGGEKDLALHMVMWPSSSRLLTELLSSFFRTNLGKISLTKPNHRHALSNLYFCDLSEFTYVAKSLACNCLSNRRHLFRFLVLQENVDLAADIAGPGIPHRDLETLLPVFVTIGEQEPIAELDTKMSPVLGKNYILRRAIEEAAQQFEKAPTGPISTQTLLTDLFNLNMELSSRVFRSIIKGTVKLGTRGMCLYQGALERMTRMPEKCYRFAFEEALKANRHDIITKALTESGSETEQFQWARVDILMDIIFEACEQNIFDPLPILRNLCPADIHRFDEVLELLRRVVWRMLRLELWDTYLPVLNEWLITQPLHSFWEQLLSKSDLFSRDMMESTLSRLVTRCMEKGYHNVAYFLVRVIKAWDILATLCQDAQFSLPFCSPNCIRAAVENATVPVVMALLHGFDIEKEGVHWPDIHASKQVRKALATACCERGLSRWAVVLAYPEWEIMMDVLDTVQCFKTETVVLWKAALFQRWDVVRKLMHRCESPFLLCLMFEKAILKGKLDVARSLIWRIDLTLSNSYLFGETNWGDILEYILGSSEPAACEEAVRLCIEAGVSADSRQRSADALSNFSCPLLYVLCQRDENNPLFCNEEIVSMMLQSGAFSHKALAKLRSIALQKLDQDPSEGAEKKRRCYRMVLKAAASPCRLLHLTRLAVSAAIGNHAGRPMRIHSLGLPQPLTDQLYFKPWTLPPIGS